MTSATPLPPNMGEDLDAIRRRVLNVVGHELRTPVTTLHGLAERVASATDLTTVTEELGPALLRNARRLELLLDDLLVAAGITTALPVGEPEATDPAALARASWDGDDLELSGTPGLLVLAAPGVVDRILREVLDNARRYGDRAPSVRVSRNDSLVEVAVDSPGPPLHPEELRLATETFFRGERAVTTHPGLGVGLAIARALAEQAGGRLELAAADGGTITRLLLPEARR